MRRYLLLALIAPLMIPATLLGAVTAHALTPLQVFENSPGRYDFSVYNPNDVRILYRCKFETRKHYHGVVRHEFIDPFETREYIGGEDISVEAQTGRILWVKCRILAAEGE